MIVECMARADELVARAARASVPIGIPRRDEAAITNYLGGRDVGKSIAGLTRRWLVDIPRTFIQQTCARWVVCCAAACRMEQEISGTLQG
jgi:hypothetical protein